MLLPKGVHDFEFEVAAESEATQAVAAVLAALAVDPLISDEIRAQGGIEPLITMVRTGARSMSARHGAACLARMAYNNQASQAAIREAGGISPLVELCKDALDTWAVSEEDEQAAQHGAGALWILAAETESKEAILACAGALATLASMLGGRAGDKASGNAAGALLALLNGSLQTDPVSVLAEVAAA
eukprot:5611690-Prymnesium_polylepis.1